MEILELIRQPWYIAGPLVGLTVPALLILGNKSFGIMVLYDTLVRCIQQVLFYI
jgi:hypothetical protein